jgi:flavin-binding protein dodecin
VIGSLQRQRHVRATAARRLQAITLEPGTVPPVQVVCVRLRMTSSAGDMSRPAAAPTKRRFTMPAAENDHVYKILELVGSSETSIDDAIRNAISRAAKTVREMKWFEVVQTRGHIENGKVAHYQVTLRVGFTLEG